jgi:hypothetical protein
MCPSRYRAAPLHNSTAGTVSSASPALLMSSGLASSSRSLDDAAWVSSPRATELAAEKAAKKAQETD